MCTYSNFVRNIKFLKFLINNEFHKKNKEIIRKNLKEITMVSDIADSVSVSSEEMEKLVKQFSELGARIALQTCLNLIKNIKKNYPKVPEGEFVSLAVETLKENNFQVVDARIPTSRRLKELKEEDKCAKILPTGKNKGKRCSIPRTEGSEYCKRHRNKILTSSGKEAPYQKQITNYLNILQPKGHEIKKPVPLDLSQYNNENKYLDVNTNIMFRLNEDNEDKEYVAFGVYVPGKGVTNTLSENEKLICDRNSWKYDVEEK